MFQRTTYFDARSILMLVLMAVAAFAPADALEVNPDSKDVTLAIGDNLTVSWDGLLSDALVRIVLADETDAIIFEAQLKAKADGTLSPTLVWSGTGVVGCDAGAEPAPGEYRFARLEEAEDALKDRTFNLALLDDATQASIARIPLRLVAAEQDVIYFSDSDGCPRCRYGLEEPVFLSGSRVVSSFWMFLIEAGEEIPEEGDPLDDARGAPQRIEPLSSYFTEQVAGGLTLGPAYLGALEPSDGEGSEPPDVLTPTGYMIDPTLCGTCPPELPGPMNIRVRDPDKPTCD